MIKLTGSGISVSAISACNYSNFHLTFTVTEYGTRPIKLVRCRQNNKYESLCYWIILWIQHLHELDYISVSSSRLFWNPLSTHFPSHRPTQNFSVQMYEETKDIPWSDYMLSVMYLDRKFTINHWKFSRLSTISNVISVDYDAAYST